MASKEILTTAEAAEYLGVSQVFLRRHRTTGQGPAFIRIAANKVNYRLVDLDDWVDQRRCLSTSEYEVA